MGWRRLQRRAPRARALIHSSMLLAACTARPLWYLRLTCGARAPDGVNAQVRTAHARVVGAVGVCVQRQRAGGT